jgi:2'-5' RNA ligase
MVQILTLRFDPETQSLFEGLRQLYFPPERNQIPAHLTLFHHLPDTVLIRTELCHAAQAQEAFPVRVTGLRSLGKGVAYTLASPLLLDLHRCLADAFQDHLIPQDRQRFMPHVVVQNKATPEEARGLLAKLQQQFEPWSVQAIGLDRWEYLGGPWRHLETHEFRKG